LGVASWIPKDREKRRSIKFGPNAPVPPHRRTGKKEKRKEGKRRRRRRVSGEKGDGGMATGQKIGLRFQSPTSLIFSETF